MVNERALERRDLGPDEVVIGRVLAGEVELYAVIMRRYNRRLFRVVRAIVRVDEDAEDVMQHAYMHGYEHLAKFRGESSFATWLTRIAVHEALRRVRIGRRSAFLEDEVGDEDELMATDERTVEHLTADGELRKALERAIDGLPPAFRTVFMLRAVEEMSTADAALALGIPEDTVKTRLYRARGLLQSALAERVDASTRDAFSFERPRCDRLVEAVLDRLRAARGTLR